MLLSTWHLLFVVAFVTSYIALARRIDERLGGGVATVLWGLVALGAFEHITVLEDGTTVTHAVPSVGILAATFALVMLAFSFAAVTGNLPPVKETRFRNT